jgi:hypothetical protein
MDRGNRITLLWPNWGSTPIPSDSQSEMQLIAAQAQESKKHIQFFSSIFLSFLVSFFFLWVK